MDFCFIFASLRFFLLVMTFIDLDYGLAIGVHFDFPSPPRGVALSLTWVEFSSLWTYILRRATIVKADEVSLEIQDNVINHL
jgi:hypothetical protein